MNDPAVMIARDPLGCHEVRWPLRHLTLAGEHWPASQPQGERPPIVALHGWLDNCRSFARLAPELTDLGDVYAVDLAGHGHSDHRPPGQGYPLMEYVADLEELLDSHFSGPVDLVSHSLGGIVSILFAAAFPEKVRKVAMIDSLGPISKPPEELVDQLRRSIRKRLSGSGHPAVYPDHESAARVRAQGMIPLSHEAAMLLISRSMKAVDGGFAWRTDARLRHPSMLMMDEQQVLAVLARVAPPVLFVEARNGLLSRRPQWDARIRAIASLTHVEVPGSHHCHLEGDISPVVAAIRKFLTDGK
nr:alpha/beta hydrolase fold carboxyl esterase [uncultured bacterium]